jgi:hypothetical protein
VRVAMAVLSLTSSTGISLNDRSFFVLIIIALFGLIVPNGLFLSWLFTEYNGIGPVLDNHLALAFIIDAFMVMILLAVYFARKPIGRLRWHWFVVLSLVGGLGFSLPLYWWLNARSAQTT